MKAKEAEVIACININVNGQLQHWEQQFRERDGETWELFKRVQPQEIAIQESQWPHLDTDEQKEALTRTLNMFTAWEQEMRSDAGEDDDGEYQN